MNVVVDTNVLLVSVSERSPFHWIFRAFLEEHYSLCVTTDILAEYEEIITRHMGSEIAENILHTIENAVNTVFVTRYYLWDLIKIDPDDNKFVDCAIASNAKFLVTEDRHFNELKQVDFPKIEVVGIENFKTSLGLYSRR